MVTILINGLELLPNKTIQCLFDVFFYETNMPYVILKNRGLIYIKRYYFESSQGHSTWYLAIRDNWFNLVHIFQWWIQDFPQGGAPTPKSAIIFQIFAENCMKIKEFGPQGGRVPGAPLRSANVFVCRKWSDWHFLESTWEQQVIWLVPVKSNGRL